MTWPYNYWVPCWYIVLISELGDVGNETEQTIHGTTFWRWKTQILPQIWGSLLMTVWNPSDAERVTWIYLETSDVLLSTVPIVRLGLDPFTQDCNLYHLNELFVLRLTAKEVLVLLRNTCRELFSCQENRVWSDLNSNSVRSKVWLFSQWSGKFCMEEPIAMILDSWKNNEEHPCAYPIQIYGLIQYSTCCANCFCTSFLLCVCHCFPMFSLFFLTLNILQLSTLPTRRGNFVAGLQLCRVGNGCATGSRTDTLLRGWHSHPEAR